MDCNHNLAGLPLSPFSRSTLQAEYMQVCLPAPHFGPCALLLRHITSSSSHLAPCSPFLLCFVAFKASPSQTSRSPLQALRAPALAYPEFVLDLIWSVIITCPPPSPSLSFNLHAEHHQVRLPAPHLGPSAGGSEGGGGVGQGVCSHQVRERERAWGLSFGVRFGL